MISPNSFWILLAEVLNDFDIFGVPFSLFPLSGESLFVLELLPPSLDICKTFLVVSYKHFRHNLFNFYGEVSMMTGALGM